MGNQLRSLSILIFISLLMGCEHAPVRRSVSQSPPAAPRWIERDLATVSEVHTERRNKLMWPLARHVRISQQFKPDQPHDGIDIPAPRGTRIYAPLEGRVVYAGKKFHGYGKMILIEHNERFATIYGHCQKLFVKSGDIVERGSLIGLVGKTGRASAPHLHFEVRVDHRPVDPLEYLR